MEGLGGRERGWRVEWWWFIGKVRVERVGGETWKVWGRGVEEGGVGIWGDR